jgi:hypothetical protein
MLGVLLLLCSSCAYAQDQTGSTESFQCRDGSQLSVKYQRRSATVIAGGRSFTLPRKASNVGQRFASDRATLIIDGEFAAFAADGLHRLGGCARH